MEKNIQLISKNDLIKLINNQGEFRKFYVELGQDVSINFKHISPRKRKGDKLPTFTISDGCVLNFD